MEEVSENWAAETLTKYLTTRSLYFPSNNSSTKMCWLKEKCINQAMKTITKQNSLLLARKIVKRKGHCLG